MFLDKMPVAVYNRTLDKLFYDELVPIGYVEEAKHPNKNAAIYIYNHMDFLVTLNRID